MNYKNLLLSFLITILLSFTVLKGNTQQRVILENLSETTELPKGAVNSLVQDGTGFIWLGTWKGLYRYDGYEVINFSSINPKFNALKIKGLLVNGNDLWVATFVSGLFRIDLTTYNLYPYLKESEKDYSINENNIISLCSLPNNQILIGTERVGLNVIDSTYKVVKSYTPTDNPEILKNNQVTQIVKWDEHSVLLGNNSVLILDLENEKVVHLDHPILNNHIVAFTVVSHNEILVSTIDKLYSVTIVDNKPIVEQIMDKPIRAAVKNIFSTEDSYLLATFEGILEYNIKTKKITPFKTQANDHSKLDINGLLLTKDHSILMGCETGLFSMFERRVQFENISANAETPDIISKIEVYQNKLFAGSWGKGVLSLNKDKTFLEPTKFKSTNPVQPRFIYAMQTIGDNMWFSAKNQRGIFRISDVKEPISLKHYSSFRNETNNYIDYTVVSLLETKDKTILAGTWEGLLFYYDEQADEFVILKDNNGNLPLSKYITMNSIIEDNQGFLWIALGGGGILKIKIKDHQIVYQELINTDKGLVSNFATTLYQSRNNMIWIGTEAGLTVFDHNQFHSLFNSNVTFDIQSITEDPIGFLWIGTPKGILRINSNNVEEPYKLFDQSDGLTNSSLYLNCVFADKNYTLYFGGLNGIDYFTPYKIEYNYQKPTPTITNFSLFNENIYPFSMDNRQLISQNIASTSTINLKYNQNTFAFEFSNLEYQMQEKCHFSYMLEGVDIDWNFKEANNRYANYTKLAPGTYTFLLKSTNNDGVWCDTPASIVISIAPPFWASLWAYIIYFVFTMVLIFYITYNQLMKVQAKHRQQIKEVEFRKQKELDELKLQFFTNISHEFRTPLTLILGPLAKLLENDSNNPYKEKHLMIFRNASRLLQLTNRIMDFRKSDKDQLKLNVEETSFSEFIYNIFLFFNYEAQKRNIDYRFKTTFEGTILIDQEFIESIVFNLLSNAFKYTADGQSIFVNVSSTENDVLITLTDTGRGIKPEQLQQIFDRFYSTTKRNSAGIGLSFTKRLVEMHKGLIEVESEFSKGSTFTIKLPLNDIYSTEEKSTASSKESVVDWKKIDHSIQQSMTGELTQLKSIYKKDEMIALVVDDNFEVRQFLKSLLENDFKIIEASNGKEGLEKAFDNIPDIVISDIMMPEIDGLELCQTLKTDERTDHIPVILTTVLSSQTDRIEGLSKGADSYIPKPIDPNHLIVRINKLIEKQLKLKEKFNLNKLSADVNESQEPEQEIHPLVEKAHNIVLQNLDNSEYNIDDFCSDLGLSRMQLYRKFKAITGLSANSFIRKVRLHKAAELLKTGNFTVKEVTYDVGFIDLKYFRKCFNEEFGVNPSEYSKQDGNEG